MKKTLTNMLYVMSFFMICITSSYSQRTISGTVLDNNNEPVIGASIYVKGTTIGTATDLDGKYTVTVPAGASEIEVSYIGYGTMLIPLTGNGFETIVMNENVNQLDEVVITGFATTVKRSNLANAVASISAAELTGVTPQNTVDGALYGKFKGADIRANSGAPGGGFSIRLRGVTSVFLNQCICR